VFDLQMLFVEILAVPYALTLSKAISDHGLEGSQRCRS
jgi:hypothetical protein